MLEAGLIDEVRALRMRSDLSLERPSMRAVGYRQVWEFLDGTTDYDTMINRCLQATRQLAKRQLTWLRSEHELSVVGENQPFGEVVGTIRLGLSALT
jgi:tRNA dimethylallyltransferase